MHPPFLLEKDDACTLGYRCTPVAYERDPWRENFPEFCEDTTDGVVFAVCWYSEGGSLHLLRPEMLK